MDKLIVITGQTATGKTSYARKLAFERNGELINADSRQIYKHLNIVTGKERLADVPVWLYDIVEPNTPFSSSEYAQYARRVINEIHSRGKTPIVVGGTYLYIKNLLYGFETENIGPDWNLREELNKAYLEDLQMRLMDMNYETFDSMNNSDQNNPRRLIRRIEILSHPDPSVAALPQDDRSPIKYSQTSGHPEFSAYGGSGSPVKTFIGLHFKDDLTLRNTIESRVHARIRAGAIDETRSLLSTGYKKTDPGLQTIGYKQIMQFLEKDVSEEEMIALWATAEVQYAKRQYTFMKKDTHIVWTTV